MNNKLVKASFSAAVVLMLSGCGSDGMEDLRDWMAKVKAESVGEVQELPELKTQEKFTYQAASLRSPFASADPDFEARLLKIQEGCAEDVRPDPTRREEELEKFGLDALKMVGTIGGANRGKSGLVQIISGDTNGLVYRVEPGNHIGLNDGRIVSIDENRITIESLIPNGTGCWEKRPQFLVLGQ